METAGFIASALVGVVMGLIGGGGSILTIPILVYLFSMHPTLAISYSFFIVGVTSLVGAIDNFRKGLVNLKTVGLFGSSSVTTVFLSRKFIIPILPDVFFRIGRYQVTHEMFVMIMFAILMLCASISMIRQNRDEAQPRQKDKPAALVMYGMLIGIVTGFLGAGGGFLLIPALVLLMRLPMKAAIGTSLFIISLNSLIGFLGDIGRHAMDWPFILMVTGIAVAGIFVGGYFSRHIEGSKLKRMFGWFVLAMAIFIIIGELYTT